MTTVITSTGNITSAPFDKRFGRAEWFCIYNEITGNIFFEPNTQLNEIGGAGTKTADKMLELGVHKIISGDFGKKAKEKLEKSGIQMVVLSDTGLTVAEVIEKLKH